MGWSAGEVDAVEESPGESRTVLVEESDAVEDEEVRRAGLEAEKKSINEDLAAVAVLVGKGTVVDAGLSEDWQGMLRQVADTVLVAAAAADADLRSTADPAVESHHMSLAGVADSELVDWSGSELAMQELGNSAPAESDTVVDCTVLRDALETVEDDLHSLAAAPDPGSCLTAALVVGLGIS